MHGFPGLYPRGYEFLFRGLLLLLATLPVIEKVTALPLRAGLTHFFLPTFNSVAFSSILYSVSLIGCSAFDHGQHP